MSLQQQGFDIENAIARLVGQAFTAWQFKYVQWDESNGRACDCSEGIGSYNFWSSVAKLDQFDLRGFCRGITFVSIFYAFKVRQSLVCGRRSVFWRRRVP